MPSGGDPWENLSGLGGPIVSLRSSGQAASYDPKRQPLPDVWEQVSDVWEKNFEFHEKRKT